jgi:hypothetical protein
LTAKEIEEILGAYTHPKEFLMAFDLSKSEKNFTISLKKVGVDKMPALEMGFAMDVSGSFDDEHRDGITNALVTRLSPWGFTFDPDRKIDMATFSSGNNIQFVDPPIDEKNYDNYIKRFVIDKVKGYSGGTGYAPVTRLFLQHFGWMPGLTAPIGGFLNGLFGKKKPVSVEKRRAIVFFITDGDNNDTGDTPAMMDIMGDAEANNYEVFFVFVGVSNQNVSFATLKLIDRNHKNAAFHKITDIKGFVAKSDEAINEFFLDSKLVAWLKK